jgi:hypothetical protein
MIVCKPVHGYVLYAETAEEREKLDAVVAGLRVLVYGSPVTGGSSQATDSSLPDQNQNTEGPA